MHNTEAPPVPAGQMQQQEKAVQINYGHDGRKVYLQFNMPIRELALTHEQVDAMLSALSATKQELLAHQQNQEAGHA